MHIVNINVSNVKFYRERDFIKDYLETTFKLENVSSDCLLQQTDTIVSVCLKKMDYITKDY